MAGLAHGVVWSMLASYAAGIVPAGQRGRAVSITLAGITVALSGGVPAATALASGIGWRATFAAVAGATALAAACVAATAPPLRATAAGEGSAETATALQTTTYNAAIAVGSLLGSIALSAGGESAVPWAALALATATLAHVTTRRQALTPAAAIE